jgi:Fe-S cluster assembly protein SufD
MKSYLEHFEQLKPTLIGKDLPWLAAAREKSLSRFMARGFPNRHMEDWKYTDLTFLAKQTFAIASAHNTTSFDLNQRWHSTTCLVFIDGCFNPALSKITELPSNLIVCSLQAALLNHPEQIKPYLAQESSSALINLNTAFMMDGLFVQIPKNTELKSPIHLLFLSTGENTFSNNRNIFIVEENAQAIFVEEHAALHNTPAILKNLTTQIDLKKNARLTYYKLQQENKDTVHLAHTDIKQAQDSQLQSYSISLGGMLARDNLNIQLNATGAACELNGFYALSEKQHIDHHTRIDHYFPHGTSTERYKGILKDHAKGVFNGKVIVHPDAQHTHSQQINKNLLLSSTAEMNTKPELEIYADDVQCTHGATVGQIEPDALFYLRSRGLSQDAAMNLLVHAFCEDVLQRLPDPDIAAYIHQAVGKKIASLL